MKRLGCSAAVLCSLAVTACATSRDSVVDAEVPDPVALGEARAELRDVRHAIQATATLVEGADSLRVRIEAAGLPHGAYAVHLHAVGRCDGPGFESAGPHWNPTGQQHGKDNPQGMHKGDLPNLLVGIDGQGIMEYTILDGRLSDGPRRLLDADGATLVVHARPDDYRTDPSGNSGARIACGRVG